VGIAEKSVPFARSVGFINIIGSGAWRSVLSRDITIYKTNITNDVPFYPRWWFQMFFIYTLIWGRFPF